MNGIHPLARGLLTMLAVGMVVVCAEFVPRDAAAQTGVCPRGKIETSVTFRNDRNGAVTYHWVDEQCKEVSYGELPRGTEAKVKTYATEVWRVRDKASGLLLQDIAAGTLPLEVRVGDVKRAESNREDDVSGYLVQVLYVVPSDDGLDRELDTNGAIVLSVAAMQQWLVQQTQGRRLRFDTHQGALDIVFVRLGRSEAELKRRKAYIRDEIEADLARAGFKDSRKLYLVFYDGDATECGGGPPVTKPGSVAAIYLRGRQGERNPCSPKLTTSVDQLTLNEYGALHEVVHALGFVAACAPNHTKEYRCRDGTRVSKRHVSDNPRDLMYAGCRPWTPAELDIGRDDYFKHRNPGCLDLNNSAFLEPPGEPPPGWK